MLQLQELGRRPHTDEQDVDVSSDSRAVLEDLLHASQQHAEDGLLDVLVAVDTGSQGTSELIEHILQRFKGFSFTFRITPPRVRRQRDDSLWNESD